MAYTSSVTASSKSVVVEEGDETSGVEEGAEASVVEEGDEASVVEEGALAPVSKPPLACVRPQPPTGRHMVVTTARSRTASNRPIGTYPCRA